MEEEKYEKEFYPKEWIDMIQGGFDENEGEDLRYEKISIMNSVSHAMSFFDLKRRLEDALNGLLLKMKADEFFRRFPKE